MRTWLICKKLTYQFHSNLILWKQYVNNFKIRTRNSGMSLDGRGDATIRGIVHLGGRATAQFILKCSADSREHIISEIETDVTDSSWKNSLDPYLFERHRLVSGKSFLGASTLRQLHSDKCVPRNMRLETHMR